MPWIPIACTVTVLVLVFVFALRYAASRQEAFRNAWRNYATSRGLRWIEASGPWYRRSSDAIEGAVEGVDLRLETYVVSTGKSHVTFTRVRCQLERPFPEKLVAARRTFLTGIGEKLGRKSIRTGDHAFDELVVVRSKARDAALRVLDEDVRSRIRTLKPRASAQIAGSEAKVWWRGAETDPSALDSGTGLLAALARACARA